MNESESVWGRLKIQHNHPPIFWWLKKNCWQNIPVSLPQNTTFVNCTREITKQSTIYRTVKLPGKSGLCLVNVKNKSNLYSANGQPPKQWHGLWHIASEILMGPGSGRVKPLGTQSSYRGESITNGFYLCVNTTTWPPWNRTTFKPHPPPLHHAKNYGARLFSIGRRYGNPHPPLPLPCSV